jgi:phosphonate degradation associated HDIG domain protein
METLSQANAHPTTCEILEMFRARGQSQYGKEAVSQLEHALQAAYFAERNGASSELISAALLHDIGHLLHTLPDDAPDEGIDDQHEALAGEWLERRFVPEVVEPVRLHVAAKRYLCGNDPAYFQELSPPSILSLKLQGGPMSTEELRQFRKHPHFDAAVKLRRFDDAAKVPNMTTPPLEYYAKFVNDVLVAADNARG